MKNTVQARVRKAIREAGRGKEATRGDKRQEGAGRGQGEAMRPGEARSTTRQDEARRGSES